MTTLQPCQLCSTPTLPPCPQLPRQPTAGWELPAGLTSSHCVAGTVLLCALLHPCFPDQFVVLRSALQHKQFPPMQQQLMQAMPHGMHTWSAHARAAIKHPYAIQAVLMAALLLLLVTYVAKRRHNTRVGAYCPATAAHRLCLNLFKVSCRICSRYEDASRKPACRNRRCRPDGRAT